MDITITWALTLLSLIGVWLNIKKLKACFYIWTITNFGWMVIDYNAGVYAQAALFSIYLILSIYGIIKWSE